MWPIVLRVKAMLTDFVNFLSVPPRWIVIVVVLLLLLLYAAVPEVRQWWESGRAAGRHLTT